MSLKLASLIGFRAITTKEKKLKVKLRHGANFYNCNINWMNEFTLAVKIDKPDKGIAPGQFAVFYDDDVCLGGGVILQE